MRINTMSTKRKKCFDLLLDSLKYFLRKCIESSLKNLYVDLGKSCAMILSLSEIGDNRLPFCWINLIIARNLRSSSTINLVIPHASDTFRHSAEALFNSLLSNVKCCDNFKSFSKQTLCILRERCRNRAE